jgi:hypothetical protein
MSNFLRQGVNCRHSTPPEPLAARFVMGMRFELGAQVHCLHLFGRIKRCLGSRVKARRNILTRESHRLEVLLRQLVVEVLLKIALRKLAKRREYRRWIQQSLPKRRFLQVWLRRRPSLWPHRLGRQS